MCNAVAADLLVPDALFKERWESYKTLCSNDEEVIARMAGYFKCSQVVIARKSCDLHFISKDEYRRIVDTAKEQYLTAQRKKNGLGGNYYATMISRIDRRFFGMLMESVIQGKTQYTEACKLTYTNRVTFSKLAERMAI